MNDQLEDSAAQDNDAKTILVGAGVRLEGRIDGAEHADIAGTLSGTLKSSSVNIEGNGNFNGDMSGKEITISGYVEGNISSENFLTVNQSATIKGNIEYASLQVSYGAKIQGTLRHRGSVHSYAPEQTEINSEAEKVSE